MVVSESVTYLRIWIPNMYNSDHVFMLEPSNPVVNVNVVILNNKVLMIKVESHFLVSVEPVIDNKEISF